ncbi:hypothetical protein Pmar_PMAR003912, partial [Perkinsus marinus ATCC 50983]
DGDQKEFDRQREYLEKCINTLKEKHEKATRVHRATNTRVMQDNVTLIKEINILRREVSFLKNERAAEKRLSLPESSEIPVSTIEQESTGKCLDAVQREVRHILYAIDSICI